MTGCHAPGARDLQAPGADTAEVGRQLRGSVWGQRTFLGPLKPQGGLVTCSVIRPEAINVPHARLISYEAEI